MIIVLIWWKIRPTLEAEQSFMAWWKDHGIEDRSSLCGEFLSRPQPIGELNIPPDLPIEQINDLEPERSQYRLFVNVGLWRDWDSFVNGPGQYIDDSKEPEPFEAERRSRTVLTPQRWRLGEWDPARNMPRDKLDG